MAYASTLITRRASLATCAGVIFAARDAVAQALQPNVRNDLRAPAGNGFGPAPRNDVIVIETDASPVWRNGYHEPAVEQRHSLPGTGSGNTNGDWRQAILQGERSLVLRRSGSAVERVTYVNRDGSMNIEGYRRICFLMRDIKANQVANMDLGLINMLFGLQRWASLNGVTSVLHVTSGLRTSTTNAATEGAAKNSLHKHGKAADFLMEGINPAQLGAMVRTFNAEGGTGIYVARKFVHADTGRSRVWHG